MLRGGLRRCASPTPTYIGLVPMEGRDAEAELQAFLLWLIAADAQFFRSVSCLVTYTLIIAVVRSFES